MSKVQTSIVPNQESEPMEYVNLNRKPIKMNDSATEELFGKIGYVQKEDKEDDLHAVYRRSNKYHSLLGQNQQAQRNQKSIKMSSASAAINVYKNTQSQNLINQLGKNEFLRPQQLQIQECIRTFQIELRHIDPLKNAFICEDKNREGTITVKQLVHELHNNGVNWP